jgi:hypothetical protein
MMRDFVNEFLETGYPGEWAVTGRGEYEVRPREGKQFRILVKEELANYDLEDGSTLLAVTVRGSRPLAGNGRATVFDVSNKTYTKRLTEPEIRFMKFLLDARARFVPAGSPRLDLRDSESEPLVGRL